MTEETETKFTEEIPGAENIPPQENLTPEEATKR